MFKNFMFLFFDPNTHTKLYSNFNEYLHEKQKEYPKNGIELATILKWFYAEVRKKTAELYSKSSLCALRFGLNRYLRNIWT